MDEWVFWRAAECGAWFHVIFDIHVFFCHKHGVAHRPDTPGTAAQEARDAAFDTSNYIRSYHVSFLLSSTLYSFLESIFGFPSVISTQFAEVFLSRKKFTGPKINGTSKNWAVYLPCVSIIIVVLFLHFLNRIFLFLHQHYNLINYYYCQNRYHLPLAFITCFIIFRCSKLFYEHHCSLFQSPHYCPDQARGGACHFRMASCFWMAHSEKIIYSPKHSLCFKTTRITTQSTIITVDICNVFVQRFQCWKQRAQKYCTCLSTVVFLFLIFCYHTSSATSSKIWPAR